MLDLMFPGCSCRSCVQTALCPSGAADFSGIATFRALTPSDFRQGSFSPVGCQQILAESVFSSHISASQSDLGEGSCSSFPFLSSTEMNTESPPWCDSYPAVPSQMDASPRVPSGHWLILLLLKSVSVTVFTGV